jgi:hypothetical protein
MNLARNNKKFMNEKIFFSRHSERIDSPQTGEQTKPESASYPGLTDYGVEKAREQTNVLIDMIDQSSKDAVVFIGGSSEEKRTKSTSKIFGDTLTKHYKEQPDVVVISPTKSKSSKFLNFAKGIISGNPNKKVIINRPIFLKEFSLRPIFREPKTGKPTKLNKSLYDIGNHTEEGAIETLMKNPDLVQKLAERQIKGINRLKNFARNVIPDRELIIGFVSHGWILDALASYLANGGKAGPEGFKATGGKMIEESEIGKIIICDGNIKFNYRGTDYEISPNILKPKEK